jgi:hypothetical protein
MSTGADTMRLRTILCATGLALAAASGAQAACAPTKTAQAEVTKAVEQMFAAFQTDDLPAFKRAVTPDFHAYDVGSRFTAETLVDVIKAQHALGKHYVWTVTDPQVEQSCNLAVVTYINQGSIEANGVKTPQVWLESATLRYAEGRWRVRFLHSTRQAVK